MIQNIINTTQFFYVKIGIYLLYLNEKQGF